ncbi:uncharacterized protein F5147DRAFT_789370 [Suillus discolor]|uniref:Nucleoprotein TPR/MLP1-2 domain-containing protein n=1 Tax=Suillus discolor TaxID=1912936 RepID=A0A9P7JMH5_9AGAM|nr:uncharacterized protein F5147DRAFT_789370 [Suillus discolor]KAG2088542.1 hypothetical protein F5147DRAFT_789370 [Suillus discolor]
MSSPTVRRKRVNRYYQMTDKSEVYRIAMGEWTNDKKTLEDTIVDLSTSEKTSETDRTTRKSEVCQQEERALAAEDRYSHEVILHAESIKTIKALKQQLSVAQTTSRENLSEAANAQAKLHLETVNTQATRIRQAADSSATDGTSGDADIGGDVDTKVSELRSVVAYLRKEKEIVDLQLELSKQENVRLKAQIEHLTQSLQETRAILRNGNGRWKRQLWMLSTVKCWKGSTSSTFFGKAMPPSALAARLMLNEQARELGARDAQITCLEGESRRCQERNAQLLSKYDHEIETLKTQKADAEKLATEHEERANTIQARIHFFSNDNAVLTSLKLSRLEPNLRTHKDNNTKNADKFKSSLGLLNSEKSQLNATVNELEGKIKILTAERDALRTTSASDASQQLNSQLETLRQEKVALERASANERAASLREERDRLLAEKEALSKAGSSTLTSDTARSWESEKLELIKARDEALAHANTLDDTAKKAPDDVKNLHQCNDKFQAEIQEMHRAGDRFNSEQAAIVAAAVEKAKSEMTAGGTSVNTEELSKKHAQEPEALRAQLTTQHEAALKAAVDAPRTT